MDQRQITKSTNPKDRAATTRIELGLFPDTAIVFGALAMTEGDLKYGSYNFREAGVAASVYNSAIRRHVAKWWNGEWAHPRTKVPHLASVIAGAAILLDGYLKGNVNDDRPIPNKVADLIDAIEENVGHLQRLFPNPPERYTRLRWQSTMQKEDQSEPPRDADTRNVNDASRDKPSEPSAKDVPLGVFIPKGTASPSNAGTAG